MMIGKASKWNRFFYKCAYPKKAILITLGLLIISACYVESSIADYIEIKNAEVASSGIVALQTIYSIRQHQVRLLDPTKKRVFARIKLDDIEKNTYFSSLFADQNRFVLQLKRGFEFEGVYSIDGSAKIKKLGETPYKLQAVAHNWFFHIKDDQFSSSVRYDKEYKNELPGHIPGHPKLVVFDSQIDHEGTWLACVEITEPAARQSAVKGKLFLVYLADDDTATVHSVNSSTTEIMTHQLNISVGENEIWLSANNKLFVFNPNNGKQIIYKSPGTHYRPVAAIAGNRDSDILMANNYDVINIDGNQGRPLIVKPKRKHSMPLLVGSSSKVQIVQKAGLPGEEMAPPGSRSSPASTFPELADEPPYIPDEKYRLIELKYLEEKLDVQNIQPLFVSNKTLWCNANKDGKYYWVRISLEEVRAPEIAEMKTTITEDLVEIAERVGSFIFGVFTGPF